jgi:hypothetical protein
MQRLRRTSMCGPPACAVAVNSLLYYNAKQAEYSDATYNDTTYILNVQYATRNTQNATCTNTEFADIALVLPRPRHGCCMSYSVMNVACCLLRGVCGILHASCCLLHVAFDTWLTRCVARRYAVASWHVARCTLHKVVHAVRFGSVVLRTHVARREYSMPCCAVLAA